MKRKNVATIFGGFVAVAVCLDLVVKPVAQAEILDSESSQSEQEQRTPGNAGPTAQDLNSTALEDRATRILSRYCVSCHGPDKQEGEIQLGALETIDAVDRQALFGKVQDVVQLGDMPPEEAKQPSDADRKVLLQWLNSQLTGKAAKALRFRRPTTHFGWHANGLRTT